MNGKDKPATRRCRLHGGGSEDHSSTISASYGSPKDERRRRKGCSSRRSSSVKLKFSEDELIPGSRKLRPSDFNSYDTIWERKDSDTSDPMEAEPLLSSTTSAYANVCLCSVSQPFSLPLSIAPRSSASFASVKRPDVTNELSIKSLELLPSV